MKVSIWMKIPLLGSEPIHFAIENGCFDFVKFLLKIGVKEAYVMIICEIAWKYDLMIMES